MADFHMNQFGIRPKFFIYIDHPVNVFLIKSYKIYKDRRDLILITNIFYHPHYDAKVL